MAQILRNFELFHLHWSLPSSSSRIWGKVGNPSRLASCAVEKVQYYSLESQWIWWVPFFLNDPDPGRLLWPIFWHLIWKYYTVWMIWHTYLYNACVSVFWRSMWRQSIRLSFWHSIWHLFQYIYLASFLSFFWSLILVFYLASFQAFMLASGICPDMLSGILSGI